MMHEFVEIDCKKNVTINIYVYVHVWSILSSTSFSALNAFAYCYFILMNFFDFRHAYPETTYITAGPAGTIGPITVSLFSL